MTSRARLRPGASVLRRDARHLQVGTSPGIVIPDRPGLMRLLLGLNNTDDSDDAPTALEQELTALGVLFDGTAWGNPQHPERRAASLTDSVDEVIARGDASVSIHADVATTGAANSVRRLLHESGVRTFDVAEPDLLIVISSSEPARHVFSDAVRQGLTHLPVRFDEGRVVIGPLVVPGHSPCVTCHDLHRSQWDRAWPALVNQFDSRPAHYNPPATSALTLHAAAVEACGIVLDHLAGRRGARGVIISVGPHHRERDVWPLTFHARCGCSLLPIQNSASA